MTSEENRTLQEFKHDLVEIHNDWEKLLTQSTISSDPLFLKKFAHDIQSLDKNASQLEPISNLREKAELVHFILSTPWGAPFVGETTLIDAANAFREDNPNSKLKNLLSRFVDYGHQMETPIFEVFDEIAEELNQEENL